MTRVASSLLALICLILASTSARAQTAVSTCGQIASGDAYLTNDLDCAPNLFAAVILEGGSLDLRGFTIRGAEIGVLCARPIWEESTFIYRKCRAFDGTIADYDGYGIVGKKLDLANLAFTGGHGFAIVPHKQLLFANLVIDVLAEIQNIGIIGPTGPRIKGSNLTLHGGIIGIWGGKVDIDGMTANGYLESGILGNGVRLRNAALSAGGRGVAGGKKVVLENSTVTGHANEGVSARRIRLVASTVTGNGLDLEGETAFLVEGSSCGTSSGLGVCSDD